MIRTSSVKINIQQLHDNRAYRDSTEDIQGSSDVSQENFDVVEMVSGVRDGGEFSAENGENSKENCPAIVVDGEQLPDRSVTFEDNNESFETTEQTESSKDLNHTGEVTAF